MFYNINLLISVIGGGIALFFFSYKLVKNLWLRLLLSFTVTFLVLLSSKIMYWLESGTFGNVMGGFSLFGTIVFVPIFLIAICPLLKIDYFQTLGYIAPIFAIALGQAKIGCFVAGCCHGIESVIGLPDPLNPSVIRFPVQLVEAFLGYFLGILLLFFNRKKEKVKMTYSLYMIIYCLGRFVCEFLREKEELFAGLTQTHYYCLALTIIWIIILMMLKRRVKISVEVGETAA